MKFDWKIITAILIIIVGIAIYFTKDKDIRVSTIEWACDNGQCDVTFDIENNKHQDIERNITIRAIREKYLGKGGIVSVTVGESKSSVLLEPKEKRNIKEIIKYIDKPSKVFVNVWERKQ